MLTAWLGCLLLALQPVVALWPLPQKFTNGTKTLFFRQTIAVTYNGAPLNFNPDTLQLGILQGVENVKDSKEIVQGGVNRAFKAILENSLVPWKLHEKNKLDQFEPSSGGNISYVRILAITQTGKDEEKTFKPLAGDVDESYKLTISDDGQAKIDAVSSIGVLRALETFVQLFYRHSSPKCKGMPASFCWYTPLVPISIEDKPKYPHRGILMDVARNWFDVSEIMRTISAMSWNKMNRLHLHITDSQSWPLDLPSMPEVAQKGAYRRDLMYTADNIEQLHKYATARGVEIIIEIDMPGHIGSLAWSHPELIVAYDEYPYHWWCAEPPCGALKLNSTEVDIFLERMFNDVLPRVAPYTAYFHTGGDELNKNDSMLDEGIKSNASEVLQPLVQKFFDAQHARVRKAGLTPIVWEEIPIEWNVTLGKDVLVQTWLGSKAVKDLTGKGQKIIDSDYNYWYLDCGRGQWQTFNGAAAVAQFYPFKDWCGPAKAWQLVYSHDPAANLTEAEAANVLGGEVAAWAETIDGTNLDPLLWPRSAAAAEVLWSGNKDSQGQNRTMLEVTRRLLEWRERMVMRGVRAAPIQTVWCSQADPKRCEYPVGPGFT